MQLERAGAGMMQHAIGLAPRRSSARSAPGPRQAKVALRNFDRTIAERDRAAREPERSTHRRSANGRESRRLPAPLSSQFSTWRVGPMLCSSYAPISAAAPTTRVLHVARWSNCKLEALLPASMAGLRARQRMCPGGAAIVGERRKLGIRAQSAGRQCHGGHDQVVGAGDRRRRRRTRIVGRREDHTSRLPSFADRVVRR